VSNSGIQFVSWLKHFVCQKHYKKFPNISTRSLEECDVLERAEFDFETLVSIWIEKIVKVLNEIPQPTPQRDRSQKGEYQSHGSNSCQSDNQEIILYEPANTEHLNKQSLWQFIQGTRPNI
jgi:hypothetical protein